MHLYCTQRNFAVMEKNDLNQNFWNQRWLNNETGWDIGYAAPALCKYVDAIHRKDTAILIPGCGNAYEAKYLLGLGFTNITLIDIAPDLVRKLQQELSGKDGVHIICDDFFNHVGKYDLILEQTFFCALPPEMRTDYVEQCAKLLHENGKVAGLLFNVMFEKIGPPFGGSREEYQKLFGSLFTIKTMEQCLESIPPRAGSEVFFEMEKEE